MSESDEEKSQLSNMNSELAAQFAEFVKWQNSQQSKPITQQPSQITPQPESFGEVHVQTKLNGDNYFLWSNLMERAIGGKGLGSHIDGVPGPPSTDSPDYPKWRQRDHCCFNWIINNIEINLVSEVSQYATARDLWEGLAITYGSGADPFQVSDLHRQAYGMKQGNMTLEALWVKFQDLWLSIDARDPNPMDTPSTIEKYNKNTQRHRLYQLLWALDEKYNTVKRELLNKDPLPTVREAYGIVRRESANSKIMKTTSDPKESEVGIGLGAFDRSHPAAHPPPQFPTNRRGEEDKSKLSCSHCGGKKHTRETCFHIHGYPEWWEEMKKSRQARANRGGGRASASAAMATGDRASYAENSAGNFGAPVTGNNGAERSREEEKAVATVTAARVCSGGTETAGAGSEAARVWSEGKGGFLHLNPSIFPKSHSLPHSLNINTCTPREFDKLPFDPGTPNNELLECRNFNGTKSWTEDCRRILV